MPTITKAVNQVSVLPFKITSLQMQDLWLNGASYNNGNGGIEKL
jgi:hypothetical protein